MVKALRLLRPFSLRPLFKRLRNASERLKRQVHCLRAQDNVDMQRQEWLLLKARPQRFSSKKSAEHLG